MGAPPPAITPSPCYRLPFCLSGWLSVVVVVSCVWLVYFYFFKEGKEKNEVLEVGKRHTLLQTLVGALACSGLQMCVPVCWF